MQFSYVHAYRNSSEDGIFDSIVSYMVLRALVTVLYLMLLVLYRSCCTCRTDLEWSLLVCTMYTYCLFYLVLLVQVT
jgi:hypothetical protein